jgi:heme-degrading monooxygenase HmoA
VIARMWRGWTRSWDADACAEHLRQTAIPQCRQAPGNHAAYILRRGDGDRTEFAVLTLWRSLDAIRSFAGEDIEQSVPSPEDAIFRTGIQPTITHYEVIERDVEGGVTDPVRNEGSVSIRPWLRDNP